MIQSIVCLLSASKPNEGENGKLILYRRNESYETHWIRYWEQQEECEILYNGDDEHLAWGVWERTQQEKTSQGFVWQAPILPKDEKPWSTLFVRKLECFCAANHNEELFQKLKKWRKTTSFSSAIPPYFVATDKVLSMIATLIPHHSDELLQIPGIGQTKLQRYGTVILELTHDYSSSYSFPLDWVEEKVSLVDLSIWLEEEQVRRKEKAKLRVQQEQEEKMKILQMIKDQLSLEEAAKQLSIPLAAIIQKMPQLAKDGYEVISYLEDQIAKLQDKEMILKTAADLGISKLKPIFEQLYGADKNYQGREKGERYNQIRLVCTYLQLKKSA
jgi:hypothetical protein